MDQLSDWSASFAANLSATGQSIAGYLPNMLAALVVLLIGWGVAWMLRSATWQLGSGVGRVSALLGMSLAENAPQRGTSLARIAGQIVFWLVILLFATVAVNLLGLVMFSSWLDRLIQYLPNIISGVLIILGGVIAGRLVRDMVAAASGAMDERQRGIMARAAQYFVTAALLLIGVAQLGVDVSAVLVLLAVLTGTTLGGLAIAFGLGAQRLVSNLIGIRYLGGAYRIGQTVRIGEFEGVVVDVTAVALVLDSGEGQLTVPAYLFAEKPSVIVGGQDANV